jgi:hypothetical protein
MITINLMFVKQLILIVSVSFTFFLCNTTTNENKTAPVLSIKGKTGAVLKKTIAPEKGSPVFSKGNQSFDFITIGNLDMMTKDFGFFNVVQAEEESKKIEKGWRLPNEAELNLIYERNNELGTFKSTYYVGEDSEKDPNSENFEEKTYFRISILNGDVVLLQSTEEINSVYGVRLVRDHKLNAN